MAAFTPTFLPFAALVGGAEVLESAYLLLRHGRVPVWAYWFGAGELLFGVICALQTLRPSDPASRSVALAYLLYLLMASVIGILHYRRFPIRELLPPNPLPAFPRSLLAVNLLLVAAFFVYAVHTWLSANA